MVYTFNFHDDDYNDYRFVVNAKNFASAYDEMLYEIRTNTSFNNLKPYSFYYVDTKKGSQIRNMKFDQYACFKSNCSSSLFASNF